MHVTHLPWCDFVVWSPIQDVFIELVLYNPAFITPAISKAEDFYFNKFLPSILPYFIVTDMKQESPCMDPPTAKAVVPPKTVRTLIQPTRKHVESTTTKATIPPKTAPVITVPATVKKAIPPIPTKLKNEISPVVTKKTISSVMTNKKNPLKEMTGIKIISVVKGRHQLWLVFCKPWVSENTVIGDGSCLYHAVAHQVGLISEESRGDNTISMLLRQTASRMMTEHPAVRLEDGLSPTQWL